MVPWDAIVIYVLILALAALFGWLPFYLLERISIVGQLDVEKVNRRQRASADSTVVCQGCGQPNKRGYTYCQSCGRKLPTRQT